LAAGRARGLQPRVHANQLGPGPGVTVAVEAGAASADHCTFLSDADIDALASSGTSAAPGDPGGGRSEEHTAELHSPTHPPAPPCPSSSPLPAPLPISPPPGRARGLQPRVHANQLGPGPGVTVAVEAGAASADHCTFLSDADIDALASSGTSAAPGDPGGG